MKEEDTTQRTVKYDERKKELIVTITQNEMQLSNGNKGPEYGSNKNIAIIKEAGLRELVKDLNKQKVDTQRQHKHVCEQIKDLGDVSVDEEFLLKLRAAKTMDKKEQLLDAKKNAESMVETINKQLAEIKGAVGSHLKW